MYQFVQLHRAPFLLSPHLLRPTLQCLEEDVRVLKGSLEAAESCKAAAEHQLQTAKSDNNDLAVRASVPGRVMHSSLCHAMVKNCSWHAEPE